MAPASLPMHPRNSQEKLLHGSNTLAQHCPARFSVLHQEVVKPGTRSGPYQVPDLPLPGYNTRKRIDSAAGLAASSSDVRSLSESDATGHVRRLEHFFPLKERHELEWVVLDVVQRHSPQGHRKEVEALSQCR
jgi:hypothetical protein